MTGRTRLAKQGSTRLLVGRADDTHVADIAGARGVGDLVFGVQRAQRCEQQDGEEGEDAFHDGLLCWAAKGLERKSCDHLATNESMSW